MALAPPKNAAAIMELLPSEPPLEVALEAWEPAKEGFFCGGALFVRAPPSLKDPPGESIAASGCVTAKETKLIT